MIQRIEKPHIFVTILFNNFNQHTTMKKLFGLLMIAGLLTVTACNKPAENKTEQQPATEQPANAEGQQQTEQPQQTEQQADTTKKEEPKKEEKK